MSIYYYFVVLTEKNRSNVEIVCLNQRSREIKSSKKSKELNLTRIRKIIKIITNKWMIPSGALVGAFVSKLRVSCTIDFCAGICFGIYSNGTSQKIYSLQYRYTFNAKYIMICVIYIIYKFTFMILFVQTLINIYFEATTSSALFKYIMGYLVQNSQIL